MAQGKLIVIDGIDGSGKGTQTDLLLERLTFEGHPTVKVDFPKYSNKSAGLVENYLNGNYGSAEEVGPYVASFFYALDRFDSKKELQKWLDGGEHVVSNRYVSASMGHQGAKLETSDKRQKYFEWLAHYEYNVFGVPRPDLTIILHVPAAKAQELVGNKQQRLYIDGKSHDLHEADINHLRRAEETYLEMCQLLPNHVLIECWQDNKLLSVEEIGRLIWREVSSVITKPGSIAPPTTMEKPKEKTIKKIQPFEREVFAIEGLSPEVLAVAMAKYSRSKESIKATIAELTEEKSAEFHEKWVLGYGDASVADMAVVKMAVENVSMFATKFIQDNRLGSYQEKSTRYVPFDTSRFYRPQNIMASQHAELYLQTCTMLFERYEAVVEKMQVWYRNEFPPKEDMDKLDTSYTRKLRARALDIARYFMPAATLTNFGFVMNARSLRNAISKLLAHPLQELREIGAEIQQAATNPAYNSTAEKMEPILKEIEAMQPAAATELRNLAQLQVKGAPTLIKHTEPKEYLVQKEILCQALGQKYFSGVNPAVDKRVDFISEPLDPLDELVATFLYRGSRLSFRQILEKVKILAAVEKDKILQEIYAQRSKHDWPSREYEVGQGFIFDILMDFGSYIDLQRHRLCTQINQDLWIDCGYSIPEHAIAAGLEPMFREAMEQAKAAALTIAQDFPEDARYLVPKAFKKRTLFKMNLRELFHIVELRTKAGGHFEYRAIAYEMYEQVKAKHPEIMGDCCAVKQNWQEDFYNR